jgi:hypothetical protein
MALAYLKKKPVDNGVPDHFMTVNFRAAKGIPASYAAFRAEIGRRGFDQGDAIYAAMKKDKPGFKLEESAIDSWGDELIDDHHLSEAIVL